MFYHYDGLGSTRGLTDEDGNLTDTYDYEAFGEVLNQTGETENDYMFTGEQFDKNLNQYYLRARYYDQNVGRFTQLDTYQGRMGESATLHKYLYAHGDPANLIDPTGNFSIGNLNAALGIQGTLTTTATVSYTSFVVKAALGTLVGAVGLQIASTQLQKTMIKKCIENDRSGAKKCNPGINIFVVGDSHNEIRDHIADAQSSGSPSVVTRRAKAHSRAWMRKLKRQGSVCQGGGDCDEYPMAIHVEGGQSGITSLRSVSASQNRSIGGMVRGFHSRCKVDVGEKYKIVAVQGVPISGGVCEK